jgi:hypothetical protein
MPAARLFESFRKATTDAHTRLADLEHKKELLRRERDELLAQPAAKSDLKAMLAGWLDRQGLEYFIARPHLMSPTSEVLSLAGPVIQAGNAPTAKDLDQLLIALLGPTLRPTLLRMVDEMPFEEGTPMQARSRKVAELDAQIAEIQLEIRGLLEEGQAAGISFD